MKALTVSHLFAVSFSCLKEAMDAELKATAASRGRETGEKQGIANEAVAEDARVLSNLMQSLGASEGAPGPVETMLKEMGINPPKLHSDDMEDDPEEGDYEQR